MAETGEQAQQRAGDGVLDGRHVAAQPREQLPDPAGREEAQRHGVQVRVDRLAQVRHHPLTHPRDQEALAEAQDRLGDEDQHQQPGDAVEQRQVQLHERRIHDVADHPRQRQAEQAVDGQDGTGRGQSSPVGADERQQPAVLREHSAPEAPVGQRHAEQPAPWRSGWGRRTKHSHAAQYTS